MKLLLSLTIAFTAVISTSAGAETVSPIQRRVQSPLKIETDPYYLQGVLNGGPFGIYIDNDGSIGTNPDIDPTKKLKILKVEDRRPMDGALTITFTDGSELIQTSAYSREGMSHMYYKDGPRKILVELFSVPILRIKNVQGGK